MSDQALRSALKWSLENSGPPRESADTQNNPSRGLNAETLAAVLGGPSDADLMRSSMTTANSKDADLSERIAALDNFEQLIESMENANNMENLELWNPLVNLLSDNDMDVRRLAASCVGTAGQNNIQCQQKIHQLEVMPVLVRLALSDENELVRRKAIRAISSSIRNFQPSAESMMTNLPDDLRASQKIDAGDMESVDEAMDKLRQHSASLNS